MINMSEGLIISFLLLTNGSILTLVTLLILCTH